MNLTEEGASNRMREATILTSLGPSARSAGAQIPQLLSFGRLNQYPVLLQSPISGQSFAKLLSFQPNRLPEVFDCITAWLERWNLETMVVRPLNSELLERDLLTPAASLAPLLEKGDEYRDWLQMRSARLVGAPSPLVATHNDLTMWNIFREDKEDIGIIDWETARDTGLPLVDLFYAVVDGVAATQGYTDRFKAFAACFVAGGTHKPVIDSLVRRLQRGIRVPDEMLELCFHSCWIHHAANEHHSTGESQGPFIKIVQWLALNRYHISTWIRG
jgi:thiamine kinase-like enzyme